MIERAEWRSLPGESRTPLGLVLGKDRPRGVPASWLVFACSLLYMLIRSTFDALLVEWLAHLLTYVATFGCLFLFAILVGVGERAPLAPDPAPDSTFQGQISLFRASRPLGQDEGMLAFSDGWLVYEGQRTSFSLRVSDVREVVRLGPSRWRLVLEENQSLEIGAGETKGAFGDALDRWRNHAPPAGLSRLPPLKPYRYTRIRLAASLHGLGAVILGITTGLAIKQSLLGALKPTHWSLLGWLALFALVLSLLGRLIVWGQRRRA